ncbi:MAG: hypothetical protein J6U40_00955 [Kiritimatiellae bacterium]|nr:hypothetical protein [Kiritimatiellia bacterium]
MTKRFPMWCIRWLAGAVAAFAALPGHAAWEPAGAFQVASMKVMTPQISALTSKAKFPLLPMLIPQVIAQNPFAERFGMPREDTDWGMKFYVNGETFRSVVVWPLGEGGVEAWRKAHPKATLKDGLYTFSVELPGMSEEGAKVKCRAAFTADGKWACIADDGDLAKRVAGNDPAFDTPLAKGICCLVLEDPSRFGKTAAFLEKLSESMKEDGDEEDSGDDGDDEDDDGDVVFELFSADMLGPDFSRFADEWMKGVQRIRVVLGVSGNGVDIRTRIVPKAGSPLAGETGVLPAEALDFPGIPACATFTLIGVPPAKTGLVAEAGGRFLDHLFSTLQKRIDEMAKAVPDDRKFQAFNACFGYAIRGVNAFRAADVPCGYTVLSFDEGTNGCDRVIFRAAKLARPVAFTEKPPQPLVVKAGENPQEGQKGDAGKPEKEEVKEDEIPVAIMRNEAGIFEVGGMDRGFTLARTGEVGAAFKRALPESAQTQQPLFAGRLGVTFGEGEASVETSFWLFGWRNKGEYRALLRIASDDLATLVMELVKAAMSGESEDEG